MTRDNRENLRSEQGDLEADPRLDDLLPPEESAETREALRTILATEGKKNAWSVLSDLLHEKGYDREAWPLAKVRRVQKSLLAELLEEPSALAEEMSVAGPEEVLDITETGQPVAQEAPIQDSEDLAVHFPEMRGARDLTMPEAKAFWAQWIANKDRAEETKNIWKYATDPEEELSRIAAKLREAHPRLGAERIMGAAKMVQTALAMERAKIAPEAAESPAPKPVERQPERTTQAERREVSPAVPAGASAARERDNSKSSTPETQPQDELSETKAKLEQTEAQLAATQAELAALKEGLRERDEIFALLGNIGDRGARQSAIRRSEPRLPANIEAQPTVAQEPAPAKTTSSNPVRTAVAGALGGAAIGATGMAMLAGGDSKEPMNKPASEPVAITRNIESLLDEQDKSPERSTQKIAEETMERQASELREEEILKRRNVVELANFADLPEQRQREILDLVEGYKRAVTEMARWQRASASEFGEGADAMKALLPEIEDLVSQYNSQGWSDLEMAYAREMIGSETTDRLPSMMLDMALRKGNEADPALLADAKNLANVLSVLSGQKTINQISLDFSKSRKP